VHSERLKGKDNQRIFIFNSENLNDFFANGNSGECDYESQASFNFTINDVDATYIDVNSGGNCEGSCTVTVDVGDIPNLQFILVECTSSEKVDLDFQIYSSSAVECGTSNYALSSLPWIIGVSALCVVDVVMLGVTFLLYRRKVQLEELKI